jgi:polysaccharide biosynthesis transport protein
MVTSATSGEGKTSLSSHLASSLARAGHRTLLVDGDLRSPAIHALFGLPLTPGFCEVLRGEVSLEQAIQATPARGLELMTAGQWNGDALQALAQGDTRDIFARLKENYDYVIFDSSPVLAIADALMIGRHVDGVLISILRDVSRVPTVYAAYQRLSMLGIRTLGAVVNGARTERYGSWYNAPPVAAA